MNRERSFGSNDELKLGEDNSVLIKVHTELDCVCQKFRLRARESTYYCVEFKFSDTSCDLLVCTVVTFCKTP